MSASILSIDAAKAAGIPVVENGRYTQALHDVVVAYRAARRSGSANTKTKAEVNLSGAKPWRQKGTGRARAGYKSSPVWVGGGVVFGPKPRSYRKNISQIECVYVELLILFGVGIFGAGPTFRIKICLNLI